MRLIIGALALGLMALPVAAFQETTVGGSQQGSPAAAANPAQNVPDLPAKTLDPKKALQLKVPELSLGGNSGTEIKIPGLGSVGSVPKLDFGLELLYGASDLKTMQDQKADPNDVQIRGTIKHRF